jgi:hypothetical protein
MGLLSMATVGFAALSSPSRLLVEYLPLEASQPLGPVISTSNPRFSFLPHAEHDHPGNAVTMTAYRIIVSTTSGQTAWDSGVVNATAAVAVKGEALDALETYSWAAQWWAGDQASPVSSSKFQIGPITEADWSKSVWLGAGQNEFRLQIQPSAAVRIYVASPGGSVVYDGTSGTTIGDTFGLSAWIDFSKSVRYQGYSLSPTRNDSQPAAAQTVRLAIGNGFWSSTFFLASTFWGIPEGTTPVARVLVVGADLLKVEGREGKVAFDDPWLGSVTDWTKGDDAGWSAARDVPTGDRPAGALKALQIPSARTNGRHAERSMPASVEKVISLGPTSSGSTRWLYTFSRNIVGHAIVAAGAVSASTGGNLTLLHCENINSTLGLNRSGCTHLGQKGKHTHPADTHILPAGFGQQ